jgi:hypothetical protein
MLGMIAILAYLCVVLATAALMWAMREVADNAGIGCEWEPGTNPHRWRF